MLYLTLRVDQPTKVYTSEWSNAFEKPHWAFGPDSIQEHTVTPQEWVQIVDYLNEDNYFPLMSVRNLDDGPTLIIRFIVESLVFT